MTSNATAKPMETPEDAGTPLFSKKQKLGLLGLSVAAYVATLVLIQIVGFFAEPGFNASILRDPNSIVCMIIAVVWILLLGSVLTLAGVRIRPDAGLFATAVGLLALRRDGGMARDTYLAHPAGSTFQLMAAELLILGLALGAVFFLTRRLVAKKILIDDADLDGIRPDREPLGQRFLAIATHALVMTVLLLLTLRSDERMQVTGMVAVAALLASMSTVRFIPATPSVFFWAGPIVVGVFGYLISSALGTANLAIGDVSGYFGALGRAMPLDYASAGVAGAIYGYWIGRDWIPDIDLPAD